MGLITKKEAGEILGRSERTIEEWVRHGVLRSHIVKRTMYVDADTVYALKDTEADIDHAVQERQKELDMISEELAELRRRNFFDVGSIREAFGMLAEAMGVLNPRDMTIFTGVMGGRNYDDISSEFGLTRERIRQIFCRSMLRLRKSLKSYRRMLNEEVSLRGEMETLRTEMKEKDTELRRLRKALDIPDPEQDEATRKLLSTQLKYLNLSVRSLCCLRAADIDTVGQLIRLRKDQLLMLRNFGRKSLDELDGLVGSLGLSWGKCTFRVIRNEYGAIRSYEIVEEGE